MFDLENADKKVIREYIVKPKKQKIKIIAQYEGYEMIFEFLTPDKKDDLDIFLCSFFSDEVLNQLYSHLITKCLDEKDISKNINLIKGGIKLKKDSCYSFYYEKDDQYIKIDSDVSFLIKTIKSYDVNLIEKEKMVEIKNEERIY